MTGITSTTEKSAKDKNVTLEDILENVGVGIWSYIIFFASSINVALMAITLVSSEYTAPKLDFWCAEVNATVGVEPIEGTQCSVMDDGVERQCENFIFDDSLYHSTITEQFSLVCGRASLLPLYQIITTIGGCVGQLFGGVTSEKLGRARMLWWVTVLQAGCLALLLLSPSYAGVLVARFFQGVGAYISCNVAFTIGMEVCPQRYRSFYGILYALPYAFMMIILAGGAYAIRDWQPLTLAMAAPLFLMLLLANPWVLDESPRYLVSKARLEEAERVLKRAAWLNGGTLPPNLGETLARVYQEEHAANDSLSLAARVKSLFATKQMRLLTGVQAVIWLVLGIVYMYIPLRVDSFSSPYLTMGLLGVVEIPAYTLIAPITARLGRRSVIAATLLLGGAIVLANNVVVATVPGVAETSTLVTDIAAYMFFCAAWQVSQTHRAEVFPTTARSVASSVTYSVSSLGFAIPPFFDALMANAPEDMQWTQTTVYGLLAFLAAALIFKLPETNKKPLKETVPEYILNINDKKLKKYNNKINKIMLANDKLHGVGSAGKAPPETPDAPRKPSLPLNTTDLEAGLNNAAFDPKVGEEPPYGAQRTLRQLEDVLRVSESRSFSQDIFTVERCDTPQR